MKQQVLEGDTRIVSGSKTRNPGVESLGEHTEQQEIWYKRISKRL